MQLKYCKKIPFEKNKIYDFNLMFVASMFTLIFIQTNDLGVSYMHANGYYNSKDPVKYCFLSNI